MPENKLQIIIITDTKGAVTGIKSVTGEVDRLGDGLKRTSDTSASITSQMKAHWLGLAAAIGSTMVAVNKAMDLARLSARVETLGVVMGVVGRNAGYSQEEMARFAEEVRQMGITTQESRESIIRMAQAHLDLTKASELARVAQDAAVIGNINSSEALQRMVYGIQSAQTEMLRTIGINVNFENAYARAAARMGKNTEALTENEKAQIRMNAVLERGRDIQGAYEAAMETTGKQLTSLPRYIEEVKLKLGDMISPALGVVVREFTESLKILDKQLSDMSKSGAASEWAYDLADSVRDAIAMITSMAMLLDKVGDALTVIGYFAAGGSFTETGKRMVEWNKMFEARYKASEQYLSDLGTRAIQSAAQGTTGRTRGLPGKGTTIQETAELDKKMKALVEKFADWKVKVDQLNPSLTELDKKLISLDQEAGKFIKEGIAEKDVAAQKARAEAYLMTAERMKIEADAQEQLLKSLKERISLEENLAAYQRKSQPEAIQRLQQEDEEYKKLYNNLTSSLIKGIISEEDYWKKIDALAEAYTANRENIWSNSIERITAKEQYAFDFQRTLAEETAKEMHQAFYDFFFSMMEVEYKSLSDITEGFLTAMKRSFAATLSDIVNMAMKTGFTNLMQYGTFSPNLGYMKGIEYESYVPSPGIGGGLLGGILEAIWPFAKGGVLTRPVIFPMASGMGLAGENGYEGVLPLARTASGDLGVKAVGVSPMNVKIELKNESGIKLELEEKPEIRFDFDTMIISTVVRKVKEDKQFRNFIQTGGKS